jgi:hypothetical protein
LNDPERTAESAVPFEQATADAGFTSFQSARDVVAPREQEDAIAAMREVGVPLRRAA